MVHFFKKKSRWRTARGPDINVSHLDLNVTQYGYSPPESYHTPGCDPNGAGGCRCRGSRRRVVDAAHRDATPARTITHE